MSLLGEIHGSAKAPPGGVAEPLRRLCTALLAENRLPAAAVVAARIRLPAGRPVPAAIPRELGWSGVPIFWEAPSGDGRVEVIAHVRLKRRRRLKAVALEAAPDAAPAHGPAVDSAPIATAQDERAAIPNAQRDLAPKAIARDHAPIAVARQGETP